MIEGLAHGGEEEMIANGFRWGTNSQGEEGWIYYPELDRCLPNPKAWFTNGMGVNSLKNMRAVRRYLEEKKRQ